VWCTWLCVAAALSCLFWHSLDCNGSFWPCHSPISHWGEAEEGPFGPCQRGSSQCPLAKADPSPPAPHPTLWHPASSFTGGEPGRQRHVKPPSRDAVTPLAALLCPTIAFVGTAMPQTPGLPRALRGRWPGLALWRCLAEVSHR